MRLIDKIHKTYGGQNTRRNVRNNFPLSSKLMEDVLMGMVHDLGFITSQTISMSYLTDTLKTSITAAERNVNRKNMDTSHSNTDNIKTDYTDDWRVL